MKISISKSENGGYYTTLKNKYNNEEYKCYMPVNLPKGLELEYGIYDVDCFLSCYKTKDNQIKPKLVVKGLKDNKVTIINDFVLNGKTVKKTNSEIIADVMTSNDPYEEFGQQISIDDNFSNDYLD